VALYFLFYKIESWKQIFISHLVCFWSPSETIFTNTVMQGKKQSNAKKQREIGALRPAMSCGLPAVDKFPCGPYTSRKYVVMLGHIVMVGKLW
jgi:hypothetical protein